MSTRTTAIVIIAAVALAGYVRDLADRLHHRARTDRGVATLEWVILALGALAVAAAVVTIWKAAVSSRLEKLQ